MKNRNNILADLSITDKLLQEIETDENPVPDPREKPEIEPDNLPEEEPGFHPGTKPEKDDDEDDDDDDPFTETEIGDDPDEITKKTTIM